MNRRQSSPSVMLVHGAWHAAWCWDLVVAELRTAGVDTVALDLPGRGTNLDPLGDLHADSAAVTAALDRVDAPVILVGHSYGGAVVTEAGVHPAVEHLVYVAAFNVEAGETVAYAAADEARAARLDHSGRPKLSDCLSSDDGGATTTVRPEAAQRLFYNECRPDLVDWAIPHLGAHRMANFGQEAKACGWRERPSTYVACANDNAVHPDLQRILGRRATTCVEWNSDHSPFLSHPDLVVELLLSLAASRGA
jgi:pimeloyl-ACP methyl ester carboxylesterase